MGGGGRLGAHVKHTERGPPQSPGLSLGGVATSFSRAGLASWLDTRSAANVHSSMEDPLLMARHELLDLYSALWSYSFVSLALKEPYSRKSEFMGRTGRAESPGYGAAFYVLISLDPGSEPAAGVIIPTLQGKKLRHGAVKAF